MSTAIAAMRAGAYDFLVKPFAAERLNTTVRNALERGRLRSSVDVLRDEFTRERFCGFIGASLAMQGVYRMIESAAPSNATVFITGESGTGKELAAEAIHQLSARRGKPFVAINCGAMAENLVESEIFGHVKGSFTGAISDRIGAARQAEGGTLFLDEICEMQTDLQSKLLRFLQTGTVRAGRRQQAREGRRAHRVRHQPRSDGGGPGGQVARGPLLPPPRHSTASAAVAGARGRRAADRQRVPRAVCQGGAAGFARLDETAEAAL